MVANMVSDSARQGTMVANMVSDSARQGTLAANMVSDSQSVAHSDVIRLDQPVLCRGASKNKSPMKPHLHERTLNRDAILSAPNEGIKPGCSRHSTASGLHKYM